MKTRSVRFPGLPGDLFWLAIWLLGCLLVLLWDAVFLNKPALIRVWTGFGNTLSVAGISLVTALVFSFFLSSGFILARWNGFGKLAAAAELLLSVSRSVPQIIGLLTGFLILTVLVTQEVLTGKAGILTGFGVTVGLVLYYEFSDMLIERARWFEQTDFIAASRTAGIPDFHLLFIEIWWRNSRLHLINKLISGVGSTVFLLCSIDFILSVGLSHSVNAVNFPPTLGSLLAHIDSKQDILAAGLIFSDPSYLAVLFTRHLQGLSVAFLIVFTLACWFKAGISFAERNRL
ncbi:MAG: hypothetical protein L6Q77_05265 [Bacteroidetes bacterium]|nr:hypothetical protein [Bacteroidota bacterium]